MAESASLLLKALLRLLTHRCGHVCACVTVFVAALTMSRVCLSHAAADVRLWYVHWASAAQKGVQSRVSHTVTRTAAAGGEMQRSESLATLGVRRAGLDATALLSTAAAPPRAGNAPSFAYAPPAGGTLSAASLLSTDVDMGAGAAAPATTRSVPRRRCRCRHFVSCAKPHHRHAVHIGVHLGAQDANDISPLLAPVWGSARLECTSGQRRIAHVRT